MAAASSPVARVSHRAAVIGASVAGLLTARVLSERFTEVVLLERDELPDEPSPRKGTPHAVHPHGLLARGCQILEELFPGFAEALVARGALTGDIGSEVAFDADGHRFARQPLGIAGMAVSRLALEAELRRRVRALPGVRFMTGVTVMSPVHDGDRVVGVAYRRCDLGEPLELEADLVVDCSGRGSHSPAWLHEWGYDAPPEDRIDIDMAYTSAHFRRAPGRPPTAVVIGAATPEMPRPSILLAQEPARDDGDGRWVAGVGGYAGDHVDCTRQAMAERARAIHNAEIAELAEHGELIDGPTRYLFACSLRRHYEKLRRFPKGYLVSGDALASFNPIYGQGMTVAACEALALQSALAQGDDGLAQRFFAAAAKVVDVPWQLAVGGDLALPQVPGPRPFPLKLVNAYVARVRRVATHDPAVATAFVKVIHLLERPPSLFAPAVMWRVIRGGATAPREVRPRAGAVH